MSRYEAIMLLLLPLFLLPISYSLADESRVALVIGNSDYISSPLTNPSNDARDMSDKLRTLGFDVVERNNITMRQIGNTLSEFRSKLKPGAVALVFYAGHGIQIKGENYLPAVDAEINAEEDVPNQSLSVKQIMDVLDDSKTRLNLVFLDACRNNPFARSFRSAAGGLARVSAPSGTLISYATRPGSVAADGDGRNGLYTSKLLKQLDSSKPIELSLKSVVSDVKIASQGKQEPWMEGSIEGEFCFAGCLGSSPTPQINGHVGSVLDAADVELDFWDSIIDSDNPDDFRAYLSKYPNGHFESLALNRLARYKESSVKKPATPLPATRHTATKPTPVLVINIDDAYDLYNQGRYAEALQLFEQLAEQGNADAQYSLGVMFENSQGVTQDAAVAAFWYQKAAEQGKAEAQYNLGNMYYNGLGVAQDTNLAVSWYQKAAEQGYAKAQFNLGNMYLYGKGVTQDNVQAMYWYKKAAEQGHEKAQFYLDRM